MFSRWFKPKSPQQWAERAAKCLPGDPAEALRAVGEGLKQFPESVLLLECTCDLAGMVGNSEARLDASSRLVEIEDSANSWFLRGCALGNAELKDEALAAYRRAVELDPQHADSWINLGSIIDDQRDHHGAIEAYERALAVSPDDEMAWSNMGNSLTELGRFDDAAECYRKAGDVDRQRIALASGGRTDEVHQLQSQASLEQGEFREQTRALDGRRLVARYFIGQHSNPELLDLVIEQLLDYTASRVGVGRGLADGVTLQYLWPVVTLRKRGTDLVLCEAAQASDPSRLREELTFTAFTLVLLHIVHNVVGVEPQACPFPATMIVQKGALGAERTVFCRTDPQAEGDSGWRLFYNDDQSVPVATVPLLLVISAVPVLAKLVTLPVDWSAQLECDELLRILDPEGVVRLDET